MKKSLLTVIFSFLIHIISFAQVTISDPEWSAPGYRNVMVRNNSAFIAVKAYLKGLRGYDIETLYQALIHGYCGDEDNGQTSAWYVFSALGFYPVTTASVEYAAGAPLFKHAEIDFENGHKLYINSPSNNDTNRYVHTLIFNGKAYTKNYFKSF